MLPAAHRMRLSSDFETAVRRGRRAGRSTVVAHASRRQAGDEPARVGFVVSRAVGSAVVRNRVKRRLRAVLAARVRSLPAGVLLVVRANPAAVGVTVPRLAADVDAVLAKVLADPGRSRATGSEAGGGDR